MTSVLPELEGTLSIKERRQLLLQKGLAIAGGGEQESKLPSSTTTTNTTPSVHGRSSSIHKANAPSSTPSSTTNNNTSSKNSSGSNVNNESFSSIKDRIKLLDKKPPTTEPTVVQLNPPPPQPQQQQQTYIPSSSFVIPQPPPSLPSTSNNITLTKTITTTPINQQQQQQPFIPPPPSSLFSFDKIKELHRDEYEEFEYQLKQTELELEASNPNLPEEQQYPQQQQPEYTIPDEEYFPPTSFQLDGKNRKSLIVGSHPSSSSSSKISTSTTNSTAINNNNNNLLVTKSLNKSLPPTITNRNNNNNNSMVISNHVMMKERNISPPSSSSSMMASNQPLNSTTNIINNNNNIGSMQTSPINQIYHYPIKVQTTASTSSKSDEVQYPSAPSFDEIDFPEYQIVNNVQMQTMTSNIFKPITDSLSETVSEEEDYRMFSQFKEFITSQHMPVMNDEKLYSLYISFRERYQHQAQQTNVNNVNNNKQQSPTVVLVNKSRVPSLSAGTATKAKPIVNPNSPTVSTTSGSSTNSSGSNSEKKRDGLRDVRKKYEEQKLEEMRIKQMKERNKAHYAQEMQQPCMDYNALVMRENAMYQQPTSNQMMMNGNNTNSYPTINNPNDVISNGTYVPFKASHPHQSNSHITSRAISNSTGAGYLNYNTNNYWPNNK